MAYPAVSDYVVKCGTTSVTLRSSDFSSSPAVGDTLIVIVGCTDINGSYDSFNDVTNYFATQAAPFGWTESYTTPFGFGDSQHGVNVFKHTVSTGETSYTFTGSTADGTNGVSLAAFWFAGSVSIAKKVASIANAYGYAATVTAAIPTITTGGNSTVLQVAVTAALGSGSFTASLDAGAGPVKSAAVVNTVSPGIRELSSASWFGSNAANTTAARNVTSTNGLGISFYWTPVVLEVVTSVVPVIASATSTAASSVVAPVTVKTGSIITGVSTSVSGQVSATAATSSGSSAVTAQVSVVNTSTITGIGTASANASVVVSGQVSGVGVAAGTFANVVKATLNGVGVSISNNVIVAPSSIAGVAIAGSGQATSTAASAIGTSTVYAAGQVFQVTIAAGNGNVAAAATVIASVNVSSVTATSTRSSTIVNSGVTSTGMSVAAANVLSDYITTTTLPVTNSVKIARRSISKARDRARNNFEALMVSQIYISRRSANNLDLDSGQLTAENDKSVYDGPARLVTASGPVTYTYGEEVNYFSTSYAYIPIDNQGTPIVVNVNDFLQVIAHDDPAMAGRQFRIVDVESTGLIASTRRLQLVGVQTSPAWVDAAVRHPASGYAADTVPPEWTV